MTTEQEAHIFEQVRSVHAAVADRLDGVLDGLVVFDETAGGLACLGTMTALIHKAIFFQGFWAACQQEGLAGFEKHPIPDDLRENFLRLAADCWDDANGRGPPE